MKEDSDGLKGSFWLRLLNLISGMLIMPYDSLSIWFDFEKLILLNKLHRWTVYYSQLAITCSKSAIKTLEQGVKYCQS